LMGKVLQMPKPKGRVWALRYLEQCNVLQCRGCHRILEIPMTAVLRNGTDPVEIQGHPENQLLWRELMEIDHARCAERVRTQ
jgi:hypothetical protein